MKDEKIKMKSELSQPRTPTDFVFPVGANSKLISKLVMVTIVVMVLVLMMTVMMDGDG